MWKRISKLWPLLLPLAVTATLYAQCHGVVQLQYNGQNIGTASTINFVCPGGGGGGGGGGGPTLNVTVNNGSTYDLPTNLRINQGTNMTVSSTFDGTTEDVTLNSTGGGGSFSGDVSSTSQGYLNNTASGQGVQIRDVNGLVVANAAGSANATLTCSSAGILALNAGEAFTADTIFPTSLNSSLLLEPSGSGAGVIIQSGKLLATDNITSTSAGAMTIGAGGDVTVTPAKLSNLILSADSTGSGTPKTVGIVKIKQGSWLAVDNIGPSNAAGDLELDGGTAGDILLHGTSGRFINLSVSGGGEINTNPGTNIRVDNLKAISAGAITVQGGTGTTNVNLTPGSTGNVSITNGRMAFNDAATNPATTGLLFRNGIHLVWFNGTSAINLDSGSAFSGDQVDATLGFFTNSGASAPIKLYDTDGVAISNDSNTVTARLKCLANNVLTLNAGQTFATDNITSTTGGPVNISAGGTSANNVVLTPSGTGQVGVNNGRMAFADAATNPSTTGFLFRNGLHIVWYNGTTAINLDSGTAFSGDVSSTTQGYLNNTTAGTAVQIRDDNGLEIWNNGATTGTTLTCTTNGVLTQTGGQTIQTDNLQGSTSNATTSVFANGTGILSLQAGDSGVAKNLISNFATTTQVTITADAVCLTNSANNRSVYFWNISTVPQITATVGAGGPDTSAVQTPGTNTWYYVWLISDGTQVKGLFSASSTSPTMPPNYLYRYLVGVVRTKNGSGNFLEFIQHGKVFSYHCAMNTAVASDGIAYLSNSATTYTQLSLASRVPPISRLVYLVMYEVATAAIASIISVRESGITNEDLLGVAAGSSTLAPRACYLIHLSSAQAIDYKVDANYSNNGISPISFIIQ